jgi:bifunctional DNase/RNase
MTPSRPLTHDLFRSLSHAFNIEVEEVLIYNLVEGIFFAKLIASMNGKTAEIDARTSDAVVLTIRHAAPDLVEIPVVPALQAKARFGLVTMAARSEAPFLGKLREMMRDILTDT